MATEDAKRIIRGFVLNGDLRAKEATSPGGRTLVHRWIWYKLKDHAQKHEKMRNGLVVMPGLRGVGKTVVTLQLYKHLRKSYSQEDVIYLPLDQAAASGQRLYQLIEAYEKIYLREALEGIEHPIFLLIDEAHFDPDWALSTKVIHDRSPYIFILVTGSSALEIKTPDLARRANVEPLFPLNFMEYHIIKSNKGMQWGTAEHIRAGLYVDGAKSAYACFKKAQNVWMEQIGKFIPKSYEDEVEDFLLFGGLPSTVQDQDLSKVYSTVERVIYQDMPRLNRFESKTVNQILRGITMIASSPDISLESLSNCMEGVSRETIRRVIDTLCKAELLFRVPVIGVLKRRITNKSKIYLMTSTLSAAILKNAYEDVDSSQIQGKLLEEGVASTLYRLSMLTKRFALRCMGGKGGVDFVLDFPKKKIVVEVGKGKKAKGERQVWKTMGEVEGKFGIIVSRGEEVEVTGKVLRVPKHLFLSI